MKIYSTKDRIKIAIDDIVVSITPLTYAQKKEIQTMLIKGREPGNENLYIDASHDAIKYAIKDVKGFTNTSGEEYKLEFQDGILSDECIDDLLNTEVSARLTAICLDLVNGIPSDLVDPVTLKPMEGVSIINPTREGKE